MICSFTVETPDGERETVDAKGYPVNPNDCPAFAGTLEECEAEMKRRMALWSARGDCFVRNPKIEPIE